MDEIFGIEVFGKMSSDDWHSSLKLKTKDQLFFKILHEIWSKVLKNHPDYDGSDLGCGIKGYEMDPITTKACLRATSLLCKLYKRNLLCKNLEVTQTNDGLFEFEWWFTSSRNCELVMNWTKKDSGFRDTDICSHGLLFMKKLSKDSKLDGKYLDDLDDVVEEEIREICLSRDPNDKAEDDNVIHEEFVENLVIKGILKGPNSTIFKKVNASFPEAVSNKIAELKSQATNMES